MTDTTVNNNTSEQSIIDTFLSGLWQLLVGLVTGKNTIKAVVIGFISLWIPFATAMAAAQPQYSVIWLASIPICPLLATNLGDYLNTYFQGFSLTDEVKRWLDQEFDTNTFEGQTTTIGTIITKTVSGLSFSRPVNLAPGLNTSIFTGPAGVFIDITDKMYSLIPHVIAAIPNGAMDIYTPKGINNDARYLNGTIYQIVLYDPLDPLALDPNTIRLNMAKLKGADAMNYIIGKLKEKGVSVKDVMASLILSPADIGNMKAHADTPGPTTYDNYLNDKYMDPKDGHMSGLTEAWQNYLAKTDPVVIGQHTDQLWLTYFGGK